MLKHPDFLRGLAGGVAVLLLGSAPAFAAFGFADVAQRAEALANQPYQQPADDLPQALKQLSHDQYGEIAYKPDARLWGSARTPFSVGFLTRGNVYHDAVKINEVDASGVHPITYNPDDFGFGDLKLDADARDKAGFSGFTLDLRQPPAKKGQGGGTARPVTEKILTFQGASFFYGLTAGQTTAGAGARALAIDTGLQSGEEFPRFTEFWLERPAATDGAIVVDALLDSKRATGAFRFAIYPGPSLRVDVRARVFLRDYVTVLGLAPINSMYLHGENDHSHAGDDWRPEVHASDGLQIHSGTGEWVWRPLLNPMRLLITSFALTNPQGFGLMQRDRRFADYQSLDPRYDQSPSVWVTPAAGWGAGRLELVSLPTPDATNNNIVAFWVPDAALAPHKPLDFSYLVEWQNSDAITLPPSSWVTQTRVYPTSEGKDEKAIGVLVDFDGPALKALPADTPIAGIVSVNDNGKLLEHRVVPNTGAGGARLLIKLKRLDDGKPVELRAYLRTTASTVSETWSYILPAK